MTTCVFIAIVVVGLSGGRFSDQKGCCLSSKTREKNVCRGRMIELSTEMARVAWRRLTVEILWDELEEGKWPEVRKSRACSRECPVIWPLKPRATFAFRWTRVTKALGARFLEKSWRKKATYAVVNIYYFRFTCPIHREVKHDIDGKNFQPSQRGFGLDFQAPRWPRSWHGRKDLPKIPQCFFYRPNLATSLWKR